MLIPPPPRSTLFPYTTLFRSRAEGGHRIRFRRWWRCGDGRGDQRAGSRRCRYHLRRLERIDNRAVLSGRSGGDRKSTRLNSSHVEISYAVFCLKKKKKIELNS